MSPYLDHASTTPLHPQARAAVLEALDTTFADPSRLYGDARRSRIALDQARSDCATVIGGRPEEIVFTSGGTESCVTAIIGGARAAAASRKPARIAVSAVEHTAVLDTARSLATEGFEVIELPVDGRGVVEVEALQRAAEGGLGLVSLQTANQEIGSRQPVTEVAAIARAAGAFVHTDACMTVGHVPTDVASLGVDLLSASGHKAYGPKGVGLLWVRRGIRVRPLMMGDDRERGRRAGMENLPAVIGIAAALRARAGEIAEEAPRLHALADRLRAWLPEVVSDVVLHGHPEQRLPGLVAFSVPSVDGEALLLGLDARGIAVHSGSSCTAMTHQPSHVLAAMGASTAGSIRVSFGRGSTPEDVDAFLAAIGPVVEKARAAASLDA